MSLIRSIAILVPLAACFSHSATAQYALPQDGRLLDANPALNAPRQNYSRPISPFLGGNAIAQGVVGRGFSLRAPGVIQDPNAFRGYLGTSTLGAFRRDSVASGDVGLGYRALNPRPYYDPSGTVPTAEFLQSPTSGNFPGRLDRSTANTAALPQFGSSGPLDLRIDHSITRDPSLPDLRPGTPTPLSSSIFGLRERGARLLTPAELEPRDLTNPPPLQPDEERDLSVPDLTIVSERPSFATPIGSAFREAADKERGTPPDLRPRPLSAAPPTVAQTPRPTDGLIERPRPTRPATPAQPTAPLARATPPRAALQAALAPGYDLYNDMRMALSLSQDPNAPWYRELVAAVEEDSALKETLGPNATQPPNQFVNRVLSTPLQTFTAAGPSAVNNELLKAESLLEIGNYYEAAERYHVAHLLDPANPLPLLGKGHALLAAGDYLQAAMSIAAGLKAFPDIGRFSFDLRAMLKSQEVIDIRRAELINRLRQAEDVRLRFLLGYLEYHTGMRESGLQNLERAARDDQNNTIIGRYPDLLRTAAPVPERRPAPVSQPRNGDASRDLGKPPRGERPAPAPAPSKERFKLPERAGGERKLIVPPRESDKP